MQAWWYQPLAPAAQLSRWWGCRRALASLDGTADITPPASSRYECPIRRGREYAGPASLSMERAAALDGTARLRLPTAGSTSAPPRWTPPPTLRGGSRVLLHV